MNLRKEAFFETNNYSQPYKNDLDKCNITFTFNNPDKEVQIIVIKTELFYDEKSALFLNSTTWDAYYTKTYSFKDHYPKKWEVPYTFYAQFGYISFEPKETPRCMVETKTPIFIYNEFEMIFIQSDWMYLNIPSDSCHWKFETNETYGFKIMMKYYEPTLISSLQIKNSTDIFINKRSAKIQHPYYNSDNYLQIDVYKSENVSLRAFEATVTVVKKIKKQTNRCHVNDTDPNLITWNIDTLPDLFNIYCSYTLIVPNTHVEYDVNVANFPLERNADFLRYTYEEVDGLNTTVYVDGNIGNITWFTLLGYQNGSERRYFWEYELDGSFPSFGNKVTFKKIQCQCIGKSIPCTADNDNHEPTGIMERDSSRYCGNLKCNFKIEPCLTKNQKAPSDVTIFHLNITRENYDHTTQFEGNMDIFTIYSDGAVVLHLELDTFNNYENDYILFLNNSKTNVFKAITYPSWISKSLRLETYRIENPPIVYNANLSADESFIVVDTGLYYLNVIKVQNYVKNDKIIIQSNTAHGIRLFENENLQLSYDSGMCFGSLQPYSCNLTTKEFAIYVSSMYLPFPILFIHSSKYYQKGCVFKQNTFVIKHASHFPISIIANSEDACIARISFIFDIYNRSYYYISSYWTSSKDENVKIFAGTDNLYFEFNSKTSKKYTRIELFSFFYTIKVPKNSAIYLELNEVISELYDWTNGLYNPVIPSILINQFNYISIFSTAHLGTSKNQWGFKQIFYCFPLRRIKFTTIYYAIGIYDDFTFIFRNDIMRVTQNGETFIFDNRFNQNLTSNFDCVFLQYFYSEKFAPPAKNGIIFVIESIDDSN